MKEEARPLLPYAERLVGMDTSPARADVDARGRARATLEKVLRGEGPTFASYTIALGDEGLAIFNRMPSRAWWVRSYDLAVVLRCWGLRAVDGIAACGAGAPAETVPVAVHLDSPRVAPMMAEAYARLAKQRALAEKWLFDFPEAAAIGLVVPAATGKGKAREYARSALKRLVEGGRAEVVRAIARQYALEGPLADLLKQAGNADAAAPSEVRAAVAQTDSDEEVRKLERRLQRANATNDAYALLDRLTHIDTDRALFAIAELATKAGSKPIRRRAAQALGAVRARRGLSEDDLAVRMIPTLGLDAPAVSLGGATYHLAASPALAPELVAPNGTRLSSLPRGVSDEVKRRWQLLKKELRSLSSATQARFERRMLAADEWTTDAFVEHVVGHPVLVGLARGLVFANGARTFRVAEDGSLADEDDVTLTLDATLHVTIVHPLDMSERLRQKWADRFAENEITQPFPQLGRETFAVRLEGDRIASLEGLVLPPGRVLGLERRAWERRHVEQGVTVLSMQRSLPGADTEVVFAPGVRLDDVLGSGDQHIESVRVAFTKDDGAQRARSLSEIARDLS